LAESVPVTRFKTLRHLKKKKQWRRKATSDLRKIYALDTEATSKGQMLLLADNDGNRLDLSKITLENTLKFLTSKRYENTWCFFWNLHYDARVFLRMILPLLSEKDLSKYYHTGKCSITIKDTKYSIHYIEKRKLSIRKNKHSVNFFDIQQFYSESSLADAYQKNIQKLDSAYLSMKDSRKEFTVSYYSDNRNKIRDYCIKDCILTRELAIHWVKLFHEIFEFYPSHWISSGYLAEKVLINRGINIARYDEIPESVQELAWKSFFGGRIELVQRGNNPHTCIYDINSAFPYAITKIPELTKGEWVNSTTLQKNCVLGFFKIKANIPITKHIAPFPFGVRGKIIYPVGEFETFVTLAELQSCENDSWYKIINSWQYCDDDPYYPFEIPISEWYNQRLELKEKNDPRELPIKIILNSIYGKTGQTIHNRMGNLFNPVIFSSITGMARAQLYDFIIKQGIEEDIVMMYTDSVTTTKKLDIESKELGGFSFDFEGSMYSLQNGFYSKNGEWVRSRGIGQIGNDTIEHKDTIINSKGNICYSFEKIRVGTIKKNIQEEH